jgi:hypothetical protein
MIVPISMNFPYTTITQFGIRKDAKGIFQGRYSYTEPLQYEADSAFVEPNLMSGNQTSIKPSKNGYVYYSNQRLADSTIASPFLTTWEGDELIKVDMGFMEKDEPRILDFDINGDYLIALGQYYYGKDSLNSYLSFYNTKTGELIKYDKSNSCMPDFYYERIGGYYLVPHDTVPYAVTVDNNLNSWIYTSESLIKFSPNSSKLYDIPMLDSVNKVFANTLYFDISSNELLADYVRNDKYYYFDIATEKWDSIPKKDCGIIGWYINHKKLLDNKIWACDYTGYMYMYIGKGKFAPFDLKVKGREYLNFQISDFSIDANNYLHLGTDIGLLTNKSILTGVEDNATSNTENIVLMPNPASDFISLQFSQSMNVSKSPKLEIFSILGNKILETEYKDRIDVSGLSAGVYFVKLSDKVCKFVKL